MIRRTPLKRGKAPRKKTSARKLKQQADLLVKAQVLERDGNQCVRCGGTYALCAAHVYPKGKYPRMRFLVINLLSMDYACHIEWWHKNPIEATEWFLKTYPDRAAQLRQLRDTAPPVNLKEMLAELSQ